MKCRHCGSPLKLEFLDLGVAPPSNAYLTAEQVQAPEVWLPLRLMVCQSCWLVQTLDYARSDALSLETTPTSVRSRRRGSTIRGSTRRR